MLSTNSAGEAGSDRLGAGFLQREADRGSLSELLSRPELSLFPVGENLVQPILAEVIKGTTDRLDAAEVNADADDHRLSPKRAEGER